LIAQAGTTSTFIVRGAIARSLADDTARHRDSDIVPVNLIDSTASAGPAATICRYGIRRP
jgi:hypothetical protein